MALTNSQLLAVGGVLLIFLALLFYNARRSQLRPVAAAEQPGEQAGQWLAKFVRHDGDVVGETVAVAGDRLILKQAGVFKAVPKDQAKIVGQEIVLEGTVDWSAAVKEGTAWHEANTSGAHPEVSEQLTTSADVRAPALDAWQKRRREEEE